MERGDQLRPAFPCLRNPISRDDRRYLRTRWSSGLSGAAGSTVCHTSPTGTGRDEPATQGIRSACRPPTSHRLSDLWVAHLPRGRKPNRTSMRNPRTYLAVPILPTVLCSRPASCFPTGLCFPTGPCFPTVSPIRPTAPLFVDPVFVERVFVERVFVDRVFVDRVTPDRSPGFSALEDLAVPDRPPGRVHRSGVRRSGAR